MGRWGTVAVVTALVAIGLLNGCDLGWEFLKEVEAVGLREHNRTIKTAG
jgi:hypothetical protein